jgi:transposase
MANNQVTGMQPSPQALSHRSLLQSSILGAAAVLLSVFFALFAEQGKAFKVVITACMRKLLIILNTMIRSQTLWTAKMSLKNP